MSASKIPQQCGAEFCSETFSRLARSAFPAATKFYLSQITGIPARTIERHLDGSTKPSADHLLAYLGAGAFGARLTAVLLPKTEPCDIPSGPSSFGPVMAEKAGQHEEEV